MGVKKQKTAVIATLLFYIIIVFWVTVFIRPVSVYSAKLEVFWSYRRWFSGDWRLGKQILYNIIMFMPLGFLLSVELNNFKYAFGLVLISSVLLSGIIEIFQILLMRGLFELDDIINNTCGAICGWGVYQILRKLSPEKYLRVIIAAINITVLFAGGLFAFTNIQKKEEKTSNKPKLFCFQIDDVSLEGNNLKLRGVSFLYKHKISEPAICLKSVNGTVEMDVDYGYIRDEVDSYFKDEFNYLNTGFIASCIIDPAKEYEVFVNFGWLLDFSTGVYITGDNIHYTPEAEFIPPQTEGTSLNQIVQNGYLRVFQPDYHCWVYQYEDTLYWIADQNFYFEDDGSTYIQFHLRTTQIENLPKIRLDNGWYWDNIGGYFEDYEITGNMDCGRYRVMKRELPTAYSITSIVTGYYKNGKWIWKDCFRPVYHFE